MISARDSKHETRFISMASLEIFRVGFVIEDMEGGDLSKEAKDQLTNICENHPFVMSLLVKEFEKGDDYFTRLRVRPNMLLEVERLCSLLSDYVPYEMAMQNLFRRL